MKNILTLIEKNDWELEYVGRSGRSYKAEMSGRSVRPDGSWELLMGYGSTPKIALSELDKSAGAFLKKLEAFNKKKTSKPP